MGKAKNPCFRIITCGAKSAEDDNNDDLPPPLSKASSDKRRWSFRKKSVGYQVQSNTLISEPQFTGYDKANSEASANNFDVVKNSSVPEKKPVIKEDNDIAPPSSTVVNPVVTNEVETSTTATVDDASLQENIAIVIQAAIRSSLAHSELQKLKKVIKLQAAVRGHLVRRQAIGSLRCVQALVKMQALVRARLANQAVEKYSTQEKHDASTQTDIQRIILVKRNSTIEKLLANGFARQLLETKSTTKPIHISCDPLKSDSAWKWLERWMSITSSNEGQQWELNMDHDNQDEDVKSERIDFKDIDDEPVMHARTLSNSYICESTPAATEDEELPSADYGEVRPLSPNDENKQSQHEEDLKNVHGIESDEKTPTPVSSQLQNDAISLSEDDNCSKPTFATEMMPPSDPVENESKKLENGSKKLRNPLFAAVQAKFEELSSAPKASKSVSYVSRDASVVNAEEISTKKTTQNPASYVAASECGTEISISSTLDSPDQSEADAGEIVLELGTLEGRHEVHDTTSNGYNIENTDNAKEPSADSIVLQEQNLMETDTNITDSVSGYDSIQEKEQPRSIEVQQENSVSSPRVSPKSQQKVPESDGTPSSQVSVSSRTRKKDKKAAAVSKARSKIISKNSPSNIKNSSSERNSMEHLPTDANSAKRRSSFGTAKPENSENEPRLSCSSTIPSYMQATKSAMAKAHGSVSLQTSPDVHEKDNHIKKRRSLPINDEKQGSSPRVQRSASQPKQSLKAHNTHSPQTSAERRWQR